MRLIATKEELIKNLFTLESYISGNSNPDYRKYACDRIRLGNNFIVYKVNGDFRFAPSRFVGYKDNSLIKHNKNNYKDGRHTDRAITSVLGVRRSVNSKIELRFIEYCELLGVEPKKITRSYWMIDEDVESSFNSIEFSEGKQLERIHKYKERNTSLIKQLKAARAANLSCEVCGFNFKDVYGKIGEGYIEAHHTKPIATMKKGEVTRIEDMAIVCANCHRMIHSKIPCNTIKEIQKHIKK